MKELTRADFDTVIRSGNDLIIFCYQNENAPSILGIDTMKEIDGMIGKEFQMYLVNVDHEPEIVDALSSVNIPEYITLKNCKIHRRSSELLSPSQVLDMLK